MELITIHDFLDDLLSIIQDQSNIHTVYPSSVVLTWKEISTILLQKKPQDPEKIKPRERISSAKFTFLPLTLRLLLHPHYGESFPKSLEARESVRSQLLEISQSQVLNQRILITGCSSGLGQAVTRKLINLGFKVYGVDKNPPNINHDNFNFFCIDFNQSGYESKLESIIDTHNIDVVAACAGIGPKNRFSILDIEESRRVFEVNFFSNLVLLKKMLKNSGPNCAFIFIGSSTSVLPLPGFTLYSSSKSALESFYNSIHIEERDVKFLFILPSGIKTNFQKNNNVPLGILDRVFLIKPEKIAEYISHWIFKKKKRNKLKYFGIPVRIFLILKIFPSRIRDRITQSLTRAFR